MSGSGVSGSGGIDTVTLAQPNRRFPWLSQSDVDATRSVVATPTFARVLTLALRGEDASAPPAEATH